MRNSARKWNDEVGQRIAFSRPGCEPSFFSEAKTRTTKRSDKWSIKQDRSSVVFTTKGRRWSKSSRGWLLDNIRPRFERSSCRSINSFVSRHGIEYQGRKEGKEGRQRGNPILLQICYVAAAVLPAHCRALQSSSFAIALGHVSAPLRSLIMRACPPSSSLSGIRRWYAPIASSPANLCTEHCLATVSPQTEFVAKEFFAPHISLSRRIIRGNVCAYVASALD